MKTVGVDLEIAVQDCVDPTWVTNNSVATNQGQLPEGLLAAYPIAESIWETWFQRWLSLLYPAHILNAAAAIADPSYELTLRLTDDAEIQTLNAQYRQIDRPTDVLAFAALEVESPQGDEIEALPLYLGDIVISVETAVRQAQERGHALPVELAWLATHGLLHLLGWDHPDEASLIQMLEQQASLLEAVAIVPAITSADFSHLSTP